MPVFVLGAYNWYLVVQVRKTKMVSRFCYPESRYNLYRYRMQHHLHNNRPGHCRIEFGPDRGRLRFLEGQEQVGSLVK